MAKSRKRAEKGEITLWRRGGKLWLRWRFEGQQFQVSLGLDDTPYNSLKAQEAATRIKTDIAYGQFNPENLTAYKPSLRAAEDEIDLKLPDPSTVNRFEAYIEHRRSEGTSGQAISSRYSPMLSNLKRFKVNVEDEPTARAFVDVLRSRQSPRIANQNLTMLKSFSDWLRESEPVRDNPFAKIKPLKVAKSQSRKKPFSKQEINLFLETIKKDRYYSHYHDFCMVLFYLGLRPSEAIGLRWKNIDFDRREVTICESLSRSSEGKTAGYARQQKGLKTIDGDRVLDITDKLFDMFQGRRRVAANPESLVFLAPEGKAIDDHNFSQRCWRSICEKAKIPYRPPYNARHSLLSHLIESGATLLQRTF